MTHTDVEFHGRTIRLDGQTFIRCRFRDCRFVYGGGEPPSIDSCSFDGFALAFDGAAGLTMSFLTRLYHGGFERLVETTFENIRKPNTSRQVAH